MSQQSEHVAEIDMDARLQALEAELAPSIAEALEPVRADPSFKMELEQNLIAKADKRAERQHLIRTFGLIGGGLLTIVAGVVGVILLKRQNRDSGDGQGSGQAAPAAAPVG